jgi:hypothetical protein
MVLSYVTWSSARVSLRRVVKPMRPFRGVRRSWLICDGAWDGKINNFKRRGMAKSWRGGVSYRTVVHFKSFGTRLSVCQAFCYVALCYDM